MSAMLIKNARVVNEGITTKTDLLIVGKRIERIAKNIPPKTKR